MSRFALPHQLVNFLVLLLCNLKFYFIFFCLDIFAEMGEEFTADLLQEDGGFTEDISANVNELVELGVDPNIANELGGMFQEG